MFCAHLIPALPTFFNSCLHRAIDVFWLEIITNYVDVLIRKWKLRWIGCTLRRAITRFLIIPCNGTQYLRVVDELAAQIYMTQNSGSRRQPWIFMAQMIKKNYGNKWPQIWIALDGFKLTIYQQMIKLIFKGIPNSKRQYME